MASESLAEDQSESSLSNVVLHTDGKSVQLNDQFASGDDYAPKVRKTYTITKQRERWTEEEHKKFLEALKLYGRAWRRIEEHVGTKTAVQIRSHAQKFFSKVVRESSDANEVKPIEIPPPRPKRKPMHPYPRKMATPVKSGGGATHILLEQRPKRSASPNSSGSDQENQSPTSVLSAVGSDTFSPNGCSSPASSAAGVKPSSEPDLAPDETENGSSSPVEENESSLPINQIPVKLQSSWEDKEFVKEGSSEAASSSTQSLKLFGKTVLVTDSHRPSSPTSGTCKSLDVTPPDISQSNSNFGWSGNLPCGAPVYYMQFLSENLETTPVAAASSATPMWSLYGGFSVSYPFMQLHNPAPVNEDGSEINCDFDMQSETKKASLFRPSKGSAFSELKSSTKGKCVKGFVPYKRCLAERDASSSMVTGEEREEQRIRLCL